MATSPKQQFLDAYDREHAITMRLLRAYPPTKGDLKPHARLRTARELAWIFVLERGLGGMVLNGEFGAKPPAPQPPAPPWDDILPALEKAHKDFGALVRGLPDAKLEETVKFLTGPKQVGDVKRMDFLWFLLGDQIHHRGQLSVYLRMADAKVPSIYGPSGDEPWM
ncbi:MAG TPA: DinB family protein [Gemmatimonadales bacterium]|nr:DinB family protein [Gemmatimonadales bacterium]